MEPSTLVCVEPPTYLLTQPEHSELVRAYTVIITFGSVASGKELIY